MRILTDEDAALAATIGSNAERPWFPYLVPEDASETALAMLDTPTLVLAFQDTVIVAQRAATADDSEPVSDDFEVLLDIRSRLFHELVRRLEEVDYQTQYRRLLAPATPSAAQRLAS